LWHNGSVPTETDQAVDYLLGETASQPRADARENLRRLVEAARQAVAEIGIGVTAHDIADRAGVGVGTFYRRVGSREALLEAVLLQTVDAMLATADSALADADPGRGFRTFAGAYAQLRAQSCGLNAALGTSPTPGLTSRLKRLRERLRDMVTRAQAAGAVRSDVTWQDVAFLLSSALPDQRTIGLTARRDQWRRNLDLLLDGLSPRG
jgi:AcrR family transcriptional regulator